MDEGVAIYASDRHSWEFPMANPFEKRAIPGFRYDEAFLAVASPEPLTTFFKSPADNGCLYDRLVMVAGASGTGKTTLARLFSFKTICTLLQNSEFENYGPLIGALADCKALKGNRPTLVGARISLAAEYRDFWELPYETRIKTGLMFTLLQAHSVLAWTHTIESSGVPLDEVKIIPRLDSRAALEAIGGTAAIGVVERARAVERAIYRISSALVAPPVEEAYSVPVDAYRPFDVIDALAVPYGGKELRLQPLIILDDAHRLHGEQFKAVRNWLADRELKVARWIFGRPDLFVSRTEHFDHQACEGGSGLSRSCEATEIWMQGDVRRDRSRQAARIEFRTMAKGIANRYLVQADMFRRRELRRLADLLATRPRPIAASKQRQLAQQVDNLQRKLRISRSRVNELENMVDDYLAASDDSEEDLRLAILAILLERHAGRSPQIGSFSDMPSRPLQVDAGIADLARIHLLHRYDRPYYFGINALCDASSENIERFLRLAAPLFSHSQTQLIMGKGPMISCERQNKLLRERATEIVRDWQFPEYRCVRQLVDGIAEQCLEKSLQGNAPLGGGANAFGIPQEEFDAIPQEESHLARVLRFGVAYKAFRVVPEHFIKNRKWCLVELDGVAILKHGLTLIRGGFLERRVDDLVALLKES